jgi:hypothetical protein
LFKDSLESENRFGVGSDHFEVRMEVMEMYREIKRLFSIMG